MNRLLKCRFTRKIVMNFKDDKNKLYTYIVNNESLNEVFNRDIYSIGTVLEKLVNLSKLDKSSTEYKVLYEDIIKVGEYKEAS